MDVKELERWKGSTPVSVVVELAADADAPSGFSNVCSCPSLVVGSVSLSLSRVVGPYLPIQLRRRGVDSDMMEERGRKVRDRRSAHLGTSSFSRQSLRAELVE